MREKRVEQLLALIPEAKRVLNVGCAANPDMHEWIAQKSRSTVGIDIDTDKIKILQSKGFEIFEMNAEQIEFPTQFDVVVAGELIEHVNNPGDFVASAARCLTPGGLLVLTTPNIASLFLGFLLLTCNRTQDPTHVYYFDEKNLLTLLKRQAGLRIEQVLYTPPTMKGLGSGFEKAVFFLATVLANAGFKLSKRLFGSSIVVVLRKT